MKHYGIDIILFYKALPLTVDCVNALVFYVYTFVRNFHLQTLYSQI
jgi:hypothetical protein